MRKNKMMRIASVLLVAVLLSTSVISGTFAKYTTSSTGSDSARVAYWGWNDEGYIKNGANQLDIDLFDGSYENNAVNAAGEVDGFANVIAPGTTKTTQFSFLYTNYKENEITAPEVAYEFTVDFEVAAGSDYDELDANPNFWWTLKSGDATETTKYQTVEQLEAAVEALSGAESGTKQYAAGTLPENFNGNDVHTIGWEWAFETETNAEQDARDTALGNSQTLENITFTITITATQIENAPATTATPTPDPDPAG